MFNNHSFTVNTIFNLCYLIIITKTMANKYFNCATCLGLMVTNGLMHACAGKTFQMLSFNTCLSQQHTKKSVSIVNKEKCYNP